MIQLVEIKDSDGLKAVYNKLGWKIEEIFYKENMSIELFIGIFMSTSFLYTVKNEQEEIGIVFLFAENPYAVKLGVAAYGGHVKLSILSETLELLKRELKARGVTCVVSEVPASKMNIRKLLARLHWSMSGCIEKYFGDESLLIFSQQL